MIVDDELFAREGMVHDINWNSLDFTVCAVAKDGLQALEKYQETLPDLIKCYSNYVIKVVMFKSSS